MGHPQAPPTPEQVSPVTVQSAVVQQVLLAMQAFVTLQALWPLGQLQLAPALGQVCPVTVQSAEVQQVPAGMHFDAAAQTVW